MPRNQVAHLFQSHGPIKRVLSRMEAAERYFNEAERTVLAALKQMAQVKDTLDYYQAMQGVLRAWLFVHVPLTYLMLVLAAVHVITVRAYSGAL